MQAVQVNQYGGPEVLELAESPDPHAGPGQVRVVVHAASVNPLDYKIRSGATAGDGPTSFPVLLGFDAAGVVDEVGEEVTDVRLGDAVFGLGSSTYAERAVLQHYVTKPDFLDWAEATALAVGGETAIRTLDLLGVTAGHTVLVDGATGGVGSLAVQIAVARGARVIGTASERNHDYLTDLGATPVRYGEGLVDRVRSVAPDGVDAVFDVVGATPVTELTSLVSTPSQVVSIANFSAPAAGARVTSGAEGDKAAALQTLVELAGQGKLKVEVRTFPLGDVAAAHELIQQGHVRGKLVLVI
jgi:NADPH:quinone reductase-like Zn-dependent oxidoreductase